MTDDDEIAEYDDSGYPTVHYTQGDAALVQAIGTFAAQVGRIPANHPIIAPAVAFLEGMKPPQLKALRGGKD